jgi:PAS domain S-box-containing protein
MPVNTGIFRIGRDPMTPLSSYEDHQKEGNRIAVRTSMRVKDLGLAILFCGIAVPIAFHFDAPSSVFLIAAMASSLFAGRKAGLLAMGLLALLFKVFFLTRHPVVVAHEPIVRFATIVCAMAFATEMIARSKRSDLAQLQRERDFRSLAETCPDCILIVNENQIIQFANPAVTKLFGYAIQDVIGRPSSLLLSDLKENQPPSGEFLANTKAGGLLSIEATCGRFDGKTTIFLRDIRDRKRAQEKLEQSEQELRLILDTIPGMVYSRSPDGRVEYANRLATEYLGKTVEEISNGAWIDALHPDEKDWVLAAIQKNFRKGEPYTMEYRRRRCDGHYRWFQTKVKPLSGPNGEVIRWYGLMVDVQDRKTAEESLREIQYRLSRAAQLATAAELSASIVHEISQPLAAMVANGQAGLQWLSANPPNIPKGIAAIERIVRDGKDAREIVKGLRTLFKRSSPQKSALDLRPVVDEVITLAQGKAERHEISVAVEIPPDLPQVLGDRIQVQQVLLNLVSNAIEAMHDVSGRPRVLKLQLEQQGGKVATEVIDTGVGVSDLDKIFETFFTTKKSGMGIGLPICRSIVEAHNGQLWACRNEPHGMKMTFTLPRFTRPQAEGQ